MTTSSRAAATAHEVRIDLTVEATEFGREARRALGAAGGDELVRRAEQDPSRRRELVEPVLGALGAWELAPRGDTVELEAAAALCRAAGYWATPYPVAERLARDSGCDGLLVVAATEPSGPLAGLDGRWATVTLDGVRGTAEVAPVDAGPVRDAAFVTPLTIDPAAVTGGGDFAGNGGGAFAGNGGGAFAGNGSGDLALALTLPCWTLLGMLDRALETTRAHVRVREQFGKPLSAFQGVQFQLTEAEVERRGVDLLARYTLWSIQSGRPEAADDALALRLAAVEAADIVFRVAHQLQGATGFCDETTLSWLSRYSLPLRRLPTGAVGTEQALTGRIGRRGLAGLFSDPAGV